MYLPKSRLSSNTQIIEAKLFLKRNRAFMDWNSVVEIPPAEVNRFLPQAPSVPFDPQRYEPEVLAEFGSLEKHFIV